MNSKNYLIFDFGASNGRSVMGRYDGNKFKMEVTHRFDNKPVYITGTLYWDILKLYLELLKGIRSSLKKYRNIVSMALSTWGADFGLIDSNGKLISNPVHYRDERRISDANKLFRIISIEELFNLTGASVRPAYDLFNLYSLKLQNAPEFVSRDKFLTIPDLFNYFLTGKVCNEYTRITNSVMYNQKEHKWENIIFDRLDLPRDIFPEIIKPGERIGKISDKLCGELEINAIPVVAPATHDTASAVAGIPVINTNKNWAFISIGTWCIIGQETMDPIINEQALSAGFSNEGGVEGLNLFIKNITGLWIIQQCREKWVKDNDNISWDEMVKLSTKVRPFRSFIDVDDPIFSKRQLNMPEIIDNYCREKNQFVPKKIGEISRCIYESLVMKLKHDLYKLENITGKKIELFYLVGGGIRNKLLCQWIADATGTTVLAGPAEATSVGNLIMQLKTSGEIETLNEGRGISLNSFMISKYEPRDKDKWNEGYNIYSKIYKP